MSDECDNSHDENLEGDQLINFTFDANLCEYQVCSMVWDGHKWVLNDER